MATDEIMQDEVDGSVLHQVQDVQVKEEPKTDAPMDPESDEDVPVAAEELQDALSRPPPVHSSYLPLPWKGRLGYVSYLVLFPTKSHENRLA